MVVPVNELRGSNSSKDCTYGFAGDTEVSGAAVVWLGAEEITGGGDAFGMGATGASTSLLSTYIFNYLFYRGKKKVCQLFSIKDYTSPDGQDFSSH